MNPKLCKLSIKLSLFSLTVLNSGFSLRIKVVDTDSYPKCVGLVPTTLDYRQLLFLSLVQEGFLISTVLSFYPFIFPSDWREMHHWEDVEECRFLKLKLHKDNYVKRSKYSGNCKYFIERSFAYKRCTWLKFCQEIKREY